MVKDEVNGFYLKELKARLRRLGRRFSIRKKMRAYSVLATSESLLGKIGLGFHGLKMIADRKISSMHSAELQVGTTSWLLAAARHRLLIDLPWFHEVPNRLQFVHDWECVLRAEQFCLGYVPVYVEWYYQEQERLRYEEGWE